MTETYSPFGGLTRDPGAGKGTPMKTPERRITFQLSYPTPLLSFPPAKMFLFVIVYKRLLSAFYLIILYEVIMRE